MMATLRNFDEIVIVPMDKTNSYKPLDIKVYGRLVTNHLLKSGTEIERSRLVKIHENAMDLLAKLKPTMTKDEFFVVRSQIQSKSIPTPKLLVKDHKKIGADGLYPTRLLYPASNFTASFPKLGYLGIKRIFDSNKINYAKQNIVQASDLKAKIDQLMIKERYATIIKYDDKAMYPSIKLKLVIKAVKYFSKELGKEEKKRIKDCLEMVKFGMPSTILSF